MSDSHDMNIRVMYTLARGYKHSMPYSTNLQFSVSSITGSRFTNVKINFCMIDSRVVKNVTRINVIWA